MTWRVIPGSNLANLLDGMEPGDEDSLGVVWVSDFEKVDPPPLREDVEKALEGIRDTLNLECSTELSLETTLDHLSTLRAALASSDAETVIWSAFQGLIEKLEGSLDGRPWSDNKVRRHIELIRSRAEAAMASPPPASGVMVDREDLGRVLASVCRDPMCDCPTGISHSKLRALLAEPKGGSDE